MKLSNMFLSYVSRLQPTEVMHGLDLITQMVVKMLQEVMQRQSTEEFLEMDFILRIN